MKLSIALCTFNGEKFLPEQLASLAAQTRRPDELIVYDDCSSDDTRSILRSFADSAPFPVVVRANDTNVGVAANFSRAVRACAGDIIFLADQDDVWKAEKLERIGREFASGSAPGLVFSDAAVVDVELKPLGVSLWQCAGLDAGKVPDPTEGLFEAVLRGDAVRGATMAFRSSLLGTCLPFPGAMGRWGHDSWLALVLTSIAPVRPIADVLMAYRQHDHQTAGLGPRSVVGKLRKSAWRLADNSDHERLRLDAEVLRSVRARIAAIDHLAIGPREVAMLDRRIAHLEFRAGLQPSRIRRAPSIARELVKGGYSSPPSSRLSAAFDALRPVPM